ncbi:stalk domain-containing protein [Natranaerofaba carboxydovora]|uniref:stalk domain-containing protein n=1 Tax=Natranaerofaba carboxydovora TaxID=2742683 RepID=UPI001F146738|nr:stalk domain-containing protein [Natranaerofaba carboxydovora]UMZ72993.1 hypothetical protein ACONDI_00536 [Natranaerofaba carboxydovora]
MKKFSCLLVFLLIIGLSGVVSAESSDIEVLIDGEGVRFEDQEPYIDENNRTLVPLRFISEALGAEVEWDGDNNKVLISDTVIVEEESNISDDVINSGLEEITDNLAMLAGSVVTEDNKIMTRTGLDLELEIESSQINTKYNIIPVFEEFEEEFKDILNLTNEDIYDMREEKIQEYGMDDDESFQDEIEDLINMDTEPILTDKGRTMVPLRFVSDALIANIEWDDGVILIETEEVRVSEEDYRSEVSNFIEIFSNNLYDDSDYLEGVFPVEGVDGYSELNDIEYEYYDNNVKLDWGEKPTGGYYISVEDIYKQGDDLIVEFYVTVPGDSAVTQAITNPRHQEEVDKEYRDFDNIELDLTEVIVLGEEEEDDSEVVEKPDKDEEDEVIEEEDIDDKDIVDINNIDYDRLDRKVFEYTNDIREEYGLNRLGSHDLLDEAAKMHSEDMINDEFYSHENPYDGDKTRPGDRAEYVGIDNPYIAENVLDYPIAIHQEFTYDELAYNFVDGWYNSDGHRRNMLNDEAKILGVGSYGGNVGAAANNFEGDTFVIRSTQKFQVYEEVEEK